MAGYDAGVLEGHLGVPLSDLVNLPIASQRACQFQKGADFRDFRGLKARREKDELPVNRKIR
jgi:hypothetical protein